MKPMSQKAFCEKIGASNTFINSMRRSIGHEKLFRIKSEFPDLSINWLLYGEGEMLYWARYSWATYAAELDVSKDTISEALGHSYGSNITGVYIQFKREKIDVANRHVIDYALKGKTD